MLNCPECLAHKWLVFAPSERMVCADCGYTYPADEPEVLPSPDWPEAGDSAAVVGGHTLHVYFRKTSNGKNMAYTYDGVRMHPTSVANAEALLVSGEATLITEHPTKD